MIYLDHNSTTQYSKSVKDFIENEFLKNWFNPSASYVVGEKLQAQVENHRNSISQILNCSQASLIFTSGGTESINSVLSLSNLKKNGITHVVSSPLEHKATLDCLYHLESNGIVISWIKNDSNGVLDIDDLAEKSSSLNRALFTLMMVNNETGTVNPISKISEIVHQNGHLIHTDAVQALGKTRVDLRELNVDYASFSGHKIGSLKGVGLLYVKEMASFTPFLRGGGQERGMRSGTINFAGIASFDLALQDSLHWDIRGMAQLRDYLEAELLKIPNVFINSFQAKRVCNTTSIGFRGFNSRDIFNRLAGLNIFLSLGSACSSQCPEPSHVIKALGISVEDALSCMRISISYQTSIEEVDVFIKEIKKIIVQ